MVSKLRIIFKRTRAEQRVGALTDKAQEATAGNQHSPLHRIDFAYFELSGCGVKFDSLLGPESQQAARHTNESKVQDQDHWINPQLPRVRREATDGRVGNRRADEAHELLLD